MTKKIQTIDEDNELYVGSHGTIGSTAAARVVRESDLLIVIGSSFSDMTQIPERKLYRIDIIPMLKATNYPVKDVLWGTSSKILSNLKNTVTKGIL